MKLLLRLNRQIHHMIIKKLHKTLKLKHSSTDDLHAEMIPPKCYVVDQTYRFKKKSDKKLILSNNENKALINDFISSN